MIPTHNEASTYQLLDHTMKKNNSNPGNLCPHPRFLHSSAFVILFVLVIIHVCGLCHGLTPDGILLLSFKYSIISDPLSALANWNIYDETPCFWHGITCGGANNGSVAEPATSVPCEVTGIALPNSELVGSIPWDLGLTQHLQVLDLSNNSINGTIPDTILNASELRVLDLSHNMISGELPELVGGLISIQSLDLSENALVGNLPGNLTSLPNLTVISLRNNLFSGPLPGGFDYVRVLDLSSNLFNGSLPGNFRGEDLKYFNISYNKLSGDIPARFGAKIPANATLDFSFNNLTGEIPDSPVFVNQQRDSFSGNPDLCGGPSGIPCPIPSNPATQPNSTQQPTSAPAIAAIPNVFNSAPPGTIPSGSKSKSGLKTSTIIAIVGGDVAGIAILALIFLLIYKARQKRKNAVSGVLAARDDSSVFSATSSSSETKGITKWSCLRKHPRGGGGEEDEGTSSFAEGSSGRAMKQSAVAAVGTGTLVTVDGGKELEAETLLRASAYILGASGSSIMYKAVLEDGTALAVRRVGDRGIEKVKEFETQVRWLAKFAHPNVVRVRGFYWGTDEKLVIYEFVANGNLANARFRKAGSSPCHMPWEVRLKIAKGVARGLAYLHEKKQVHGNLKPSNILLDEDMEAKLGDFGIERLMSGEGGYRAGGSMRHFGSMRSTASRDSFQELGATPSPSPSSMMSCVSPYQPPESLRSLKPNAKWDVYSYGVVLLELLTGKVMSADDLGHGMTGLSLDDKARILRMADVAIRADLEGEEDALLALLKLGYSCASPAPQKRPSMKEVLQCIEKLPSSSSSAYYYGP
ncbi:putative LRR receptor-like serine/threonine-protein kinase [Drosera capensis]